MPDANLFSIENLTNTLLDDLQAITQSTTPINTRDALKKLTRFQGIQAQITSGQKVLSAEQTQKTEQQKQQFTLRRDNFKVGLQQRQKLIEQVILKRREVLAKPAVDKLVVTGQILDEATGNGLPNVVVKAFDFDRTQDDFLGTALTDSDGFYRLEYQKTQFSERGEGQPEVYIQVQDETEDTIFQSPRSLDNKADAVKVLDARINATALPKSRKLASQVSKLRSQRINTLLEKQQGLKIRSTNQLINRSSITGVVQKWPVSGNTRTTN